ncbi:probable serine/threonine-protein kinase SIS8 isoform X2 [Zingiber officinale]|uniref:probable serine/threonine-protein kinase SIS8 isoform X2 n=1 Tax=Zingiber officinale TaxID=94328 RepID=UPI001C4ABEA5|nr:probable serine/threonine-protein kinase SIS8 isoform X2 [Zingiber officinale]
MKSLLKKLHIVPSHSEDGEASLSPSSSTIGVCPVATDAKATQSHPEQKPLSGFGNWLNSVSGRQAITPPSSSSSSSSSCSFTVEQRSDQRDLPSTTSSVVSEMVSNAPTGDSELSKPTNQDMDEEYQIQLALELSAMEDPEAAQIEAVKQISLGSCPPENSPAEILAYRYWSYNVLGYDDKILDGFYDLYGVSIESTFSEMPSLMDLQQIPISDNIGWEVALVNRKEDANLSILEQKALLMAKKLEAESLDSSGSLLVQKVAFLVADYMGGKVSDPESMLNSYQNLRNHLMANIGSIVLLLGHLTVGLARHRALMFKVLADSLGISCRLVKGKQYTGSDDSALATVKLNDGRDYIVDLMSEPGTLIPSDGVGLINEPEEATIMIQSFTRVSNDTRMAISSSKVADSTACSTDNESFTKHGAMFTYQKGTNSAGVNPCDVNHQNSRYMPTDKNNPTKSPTTSNDVMPKTPNASGKSKHPRSPSWTEGISSSTVQSMKLKNVSEYMINAAKENPKLAQKLQDVLLESGVAAPPNLFTEICTPEIEDPLTEEMHSIEDKYRRKINKPELKQKTETGGSHGPFLPQLPTHMLHQKVNLSRSQMDATKSAAGLSVCHNQDSREAIKNPVYEISDEPLVQESRLQVVRHMPVAAAAATAAVVASSMVVAAVKSNADLNLEVPVAAAATATAAAVVATTAAVSRQYEHLEPCCREPNLIEKNEIISVNEQQVSFHGNDEINTKVRFGDSHQEMDRTSEKSTGTESTKSENALQDVVEFEIAWEDIILGERIGLGSFGEVYHGDWHGTEVAVKRFLHQDISSDALEEFISEVRIMKRLRHPNVVLFMGAVTCVPNLSIVTEFLHRGSLFRLIHRPNNQLDERRRLRMSLDIARGMNYLHNCTPIIVHRDLKSPNLLVDKNWVVKVCDFGLSRIKHNTFLSSRSTAGTAEWMAPEVLRNEPSDEKCDVFSFGVILWELCTLQQPWEGMNPMQVVGAVGFQDRRLDIPDDMDPIIAGIIRKCWQINPKLRPSFAEIMAVLKPLQKPISSNQGLRQKRPVQSSEKAGL